MAEAERERRMKRDGGIRETERRAMGRKRRRLYNGLGAGVRRGRIAGLGTVDATVWRVAWERGREVEGWRTNERHCKRRTRESRGDGGENRYFNWTK